MADLMQESFIALCDAVVNYDPTHYVNFLSSLRYAMLNHFRNLRRSRDDISMPEYLYHMIRQYKRMRDSYLVSLGKEPSDSVYCQTLKITYKELETIRKNLNAKAKSLSEPVFTLDGEEIPLEETIAASSSGTEEVLDKIELEQLKEIIDKMLEVLPANQQKILKMRFYDNYTLKQCSECTGIAPESIRQTEMRALRELRKQSDNMKVLKEFIPDSDIYDMGMVYRSIPAFKNTLESTTETAAFILIERRNALSDKNSRHIDYLSRKFKLNDDIAVSG